MARQLSGLFPEMCFLHRHQNCYSSSLQSSSYSPRSVQSVQSPLSKIGRFKHILAFLVVVLLALSAGTGMRVWESENWLRPALQVDGEQLLSKHDSYGWLAGAERLNQHSSRPFSRCLRFLHETTGVPLDRLAFWLPAIIAPLAAVPVCLLVFWWGIPEAGLVAGVLAASSIGYFIRTRLTCLDTDIITLLFPLSLAAGLIIWIESLAALPKSHGDALPRSALPGRVALLPPFLLGLIYLCYIAFYPSGEAVGESILGLALIVGLFMTRSQSRLMVVAGILVILLLGDALLQEMYVAAAAVVLLVVWPGFFARKHGLLVLLILLGVALLWFSDFGAKAADLWFHISRYGRVSGGSSALAGPASLPPVINTVPEAWPVDLRGAVFFQAGNWGIFAGGLIGLLVLIRKRPACLVLLPLLALGLASVRLGVRFTMYGGAVLGIGLACGTAIMLRAWRVPLPAGVAVQLCLLVAVCWPLVRTVQAVDPEPIIDKALVRSLTELRTQAAPDAQIWIWWDQGYEAQYYAKRMTIIDGYRNSAEDVFPVAFVHAAPSPLTAYQAIVRTALQQRAAGPEEIPGARIPIYANPFPGLLGSMSILEILGFLQDMQRPSVGWSHDLPEQYLVLSWKNLLRAHTILSYGNWDFQRGSDGPGRFIVIRERARFNQHNGLMSVTGRTYPLKSRETVSSNGTTHLTWKQNETEKGWHAVFRLVEGTTYLMDDRAYQMMMVQMLLSNAERFQPYFELVVDRFPDVRIYKVNPILTGLPPGSSVFTGGAHGK